MKRRNSIVSLLLVVPAVFATIALTSACGGSSGEPASIPTAQTVPMAAGPSGPDRISTQESTIQGPTEQAATGASVPTAAPVAQPDPPTARPQDPTEPPERRQQYGSDDHGDSAAMAVTPVAQPAPTETMAQEPTAVPEGDQPDENQGEGAAAMVAATPADPAPENAAPLFELPNAQGETVSLGSYVGQQPVVLVFYRGFW